AHPCRDSLVFKSITKRYLLDHRVSEPDAYLGYYTLTIFLRSTIVPRSCQPRGIVARCREGGAGCGTCERDATHVTSPGGGREPSGGTKTAGRSDRSVEGVKPEMPRGASRDAGARVMCARDPAIRARPRKTGRPAKSGQRAFSARHSPHCEGKERDGPTPRPTPVRGQHSVGLSPPRG